MSQNFSLFMFSPALLLSIRQENVYLNEINVRVEIGKQFQIIFVLILSLFCSD